MTILVSVLMPVRDEAAYLREAIDSLRPVPGIALQVVLIDDHSTDATASIARAAAGSRPDLDMTVLANPGRGKAAAVNAGWARARGEVIVMFAGDDRMVGDLLPARARAVLPGDRPRVAQCRYRSFSDDPADDGVTFPRPGRETHLAGGAVSFNRAFAALYFPVPEELPNEDTWLRAIALLHGLPVAFIDEVGLRYRLHGGNATGRRLDFATQSEALARRHAAYALALETFPRAGSPTTRARLAVLARAEAHRAAGRWWSIATMRDLAPADRNVFALNAAPWLHALKARWWPALRRRWREPWDQGS